MADRVVCDGIGQPYNTHANFRGNLGRGLKMNQTEA
jgi:hypothetical protein